MKRKPEVRDLKKEKREKNREKERKKREKKRVKEREKKREKEREKKREKEREKKREKGREKKRERKSKRKKGRPIDNYQKESGCALTHLCLCGQPAQKMKETVGGERDVLWRETKSLSSIKEP